MAKRRYRPNPIDHMFYALLHILRNNNGLGTELCGTLMYMALVMWTGAIGLYETFFVVQPDPELYAAFKKGDYILFLFLGVYAAVYLYFTCQKRYVRIYRHYLRKSIRTPKRPVVFFGILWILGVMLFFFVALFMNDYNMPKHSKRIHHSGAIP
jgi:hypothetical protein